MQYLYCRSVVRLLGAGLHILQGLCKAPLQLTPGSFSHDFLCNFIAQLHPVLVLLQPLKEALVSLSRQLHSTVRYTAESYEHAAHEGWICMYYTATACVDTAHCSNAQNSSRNSKCKSCKKDMQQVMRSKFAGYALSVHTSLL